MKLYLSSYRIPNLEELIALIGKPIQEIRVALIPNAGDYYAGKARVIKRNQARDYFASLGFTVSIVDLVDFNNTEDIKTALMDFDLVWATGGNTFILRHEMQRSGFDDVITDLLEQGLVYGGESAGAIVAGNSLDGIEYADEPEFAEEIIKQGLKLTNHFILPHVGNLDFAEAVDKARAIHSGDDSMIELTDSQAFVVNGGYIKTVEATL